MSTVPCTLSYPPVRSMSNENSTSLKFMRLQNLPKNGFEEEGLETRRVKMKKEPV